MSAGATCFASAEECFSEVVSFLEGDEAGSLDHGELEERLEEKSWEVFRRLYQGHLDLRALREQCLEEVADAEGATRPYVEAGHARSLAVVFGGVETSRFAYRCKGRENLHPADAWLNLPEERYSHGLRRLAAIEAARGSYDSAVEAVERATGQRAPKRQLEQLVRQATKDVEEFYASREAEPTGAGDVVVLSCDGKGIVMRPGSLREPARSAAEARSAEPKARLSKGEKRGRKRMATIGAVYEVEPCSRSAGDILAKGPSEKPTPAPKAKNKWLTASVAGTAAQVVSDVFDEAERERPRPRAHLSRTGGRLMRPVGLCGHGSVTDQKRPGRASLRSGGQPVHSRIIAGPIRGCRGRPEEGRAAGIDPVCWWGAG